MKHDIARWQVDPVLAPNQFSIARPLRLEDLDKRVTWHGVYPSLPAPNGVLWSEYVRLQRNGSRSVSSSTEALDSDHARYITRRIAQHARSMATGTRSLPTDFPVPYFQPIERGHMSEGGLVTEIHQKLYLWEVYKCHPMMVMYHWVVSITPL